MEDEFERRKKKHEEKWAHDEALRFKAAARRNKLAGLWAASELGLRGADAEGYAKSVVTAEMHAPGGAFAKIRADFAAAKLAHSDHAIRRKMEELLAPATEQIAKDVKP